MTPLLGRAPNPLLSGFWVDEQKCRFLLARSVTQYLKGKSTSIQGQ